MKKILKNIMLVFLFILIFIIVSCNKSNKSDIDVSGDWEGNVKAKDEVGTDFEIELSKSKEDIQASLETSKGLLGVDSIKLTLKQEKDSVSGSSKIGDYDVNLTGSVDEKTKIVSLSAVGSESDDFQKIEISTKIESSNSMKGTLKFEGKSE